MARRASLATRAMEAPTGSVIAIPDSSAGLRFPVVIVARPGGPCRPTGPSPPDPAGVLLGHATTSLGGLRRRVRHLGCALLPHQDRRRRGLPALPDLGAGRHRGRDPAPPGLAQ